MSRHPLCSWLLVCCLLAPARALGQDSNEVSAAPSDSSQEEPSQPVVVGEGEAAPASEAGSEGELRSDEQAPVVDLTASGELEGQGEQVAPPEVSAPPPTAPAVPAPPAAAPPEPSPRLADEQREHALSVSLLGAVIGRMRLSYEHMLTPRHGIFFEGVVSPDTLGGFAFVGYGAALGYRLHWRERPDTSGPFFGVTLAMERVSGTLDRVREWNDEETHTYRGSVVGFTLAPHIGKRWVLGDGWALALRVGMGFAYGWLDPDADAEPEAVRILEDGPPVGVDGEASVGYAF